MFYIYKDSGKTEDKGLDTHLAGFLRHSHPAQCPVNALGHYLILAFGKDSMRAIPDVLNPDNDWGDLCYLVTDGSCVKPLQYSSRQSKKASGGFDGMYETLKTLKVAVGFMDIDKATHFRAMGAMYAEAKGVLEEDINRLGRWMEDNLSKVCRQHYLKACPLKAAIGLAGFRDGRHYCCPRGDVLDIGDLDKIESDEDFMEILEHLMPGFWKMAKLAESAHERPSEVEDISIPQSTQNYMFLRLAVAATIAFIQDAPILLGLYPDLKNVAPFTSLFHPDIKNHFERIKERVFKAVRTLCSLFYNFMPYDYVHLFYFICTLILATINFFVILHVM